MNLLGVNHMKRYDVVLIGRAGIDLYSDDLGAPLRDHGTGQPGSEITA
jgi:hypothetical protein